jgi:hypothetical protein
MARRAQHKIDADKMEPIAAKRPFKAGGLSGTSGKTDTGRMHPDEAAAYNKADPSYTVRSYATPIAWHEEGKGWTESQAKYSPTTSRHQAIVGRSIHFTNGAEGARG